jgi:hypothetical protein
MVLGPMVPPPPPPKRGRGVLLVSVLAAVVALAAAAVTAVLVLRQPTNPPGDTPGAAGSASDVKLDDKGDSVILSWADPSSGKARQVIWGNREDQAKGVLGYPETGATTYTLYSLNRNYEYCFVIVLVYPPDDIRQSEQVCTKRKTASPSAKTGTASPKPKSS